MAELYHVYLHAPLRGQPGRAGGRGDQDRDPEDGGRHAAHLPLQRGVPVSAARHPSDDRDRFRLPRGERQRAVPVDGLPHPGDAGSILRPGQAERRADRAVPARDVRPVEDELPDPPEDQPEVHLRVGRRLWLWAQGLWRLLRYPGPGPRRLRLDHRDARAHGWACPQVHQLGHRLGLRHPDHLRGPGGHPLAAEDRARHHDRVLPGADPDPVLRVYRAALRPLRHRPPAVGELGHPALRPRDHHLRQVRLSGCPEPAGETRSAVRAGLGLPGQGLPGAVRRRRAEGPLRQIQNAQGPGRGPGAGRDLHSS